MGRSVDRRQRSVPWACLGDQLARHRRSLTSHDCCLHLVGDDRDYEYYVDTSRLVPSCLEHSGRLGPLACQVEIFVTLSGIYRYLGRLSNSSRHGTHKASSAPSNPRRGSTHSGASVPLSLPSLI